MNHGLQLANSIAFFNLEIELNLLVVVIVLIKTDNMIHPIFRNPMLIIVDFSSKKFLVSKQSMPSWKKTSV